MRNSLCSPVSCAPLYFPIVFYIVLYVFQNGLISSKETQEQIDIVQPIDEKMTRVGFQDEANEIEQVIRGAES